MTISIDAALRDQHLLGAALGEPQTWGVWLTVLRAAFGLSLDAEQSRQFMELAGRAPPTRRVRELWSIVGRRSGKSRMAGAIATYLAAFVDHSGRLAAGEVGYVLVLAASKSQAKIVFQYVRSFIEQSAMLRQLVEEVTAEEIRLTNNIVIAVHSTSFRSIRGRSLIGAIFDECAFWRDELSSVPDIETYRAVLPALATTNGMLIGISSPWAQRGLLFSRHRDYYAKDDADVLVVQGSSRQFNPTLDETIILAAEKDDPEASQSEWGGSFRGDISTYVDRSTLELCVDRGVSERPFRVQHRFSSFVDASAGVSDSFAMAIAHPEGERVVLDKVFEAKAPHTPADVVDEACRVLAQYKIRSVVGDAFSGEWVRSEFRRHGVAYVLADRDKSRLYLDALPMFTSATAVLLDDPRLIAQLSQLERRAGRTGRDLVQHMRGALDDRANSVAGALVYASARARPRQMPTHESCARYSIFQKQYQPNRGMVRRGGMSNAR